MTRLLDAKAAADLLGLPSHKWLLAQARDGKVPFVKLGRYTRFSEDELRAWCSSPTGRLVKRAGAGGMAFVIDEATR